MEIGVKMYSKVKEPEIYVNKLMKENHRLFEKFYNIKSQANAEVLIEKVGKQKHFLSKGGQVDIDRTARQILKDWQEGKIK